MVKVCVTEAVAEWVRVRVGVAVGERVVVQDRVTELVMLGVRLGVSVELRVGELL